MKIIYNKFIPFKGFYAITIIKWIFVRENYRYLEGTNYEKVMINHESIHEAQILDFTPKWLPNFFRYTIGSLCFYLLYVLDWLLKLISNIFRKTKINAYKHIAAEQEAYLNEKDFNYVNTRKPLKWLKNFFKLMK